MKNAHFRMCKSGMYCCKTLKLTQYKYIIDSFKKKLFLNVNEYKKTKKINVIQ